MTWVAAQLGDRRFLLYTYEDAAAGPSGRGTTIAGELPTADEVRVALEAPTATVRLTGVALTKLDAAWTEKLGLPEEPPWLKTLVLPPRPWRSAPELAPHFDPHHPDDLEATFVLLANKTLEKMWVRLEAVHEPIGYVARLLDTSKVAPELAAGGKVLVRPSKSHPPLLWIPDATTAKNVAEWSTVCEACGFDLVFIPVEQLARMQFPDAPADGFPVSFTTRCLMCKGTMHVERRDARPPPARP